MSLSTFEVGLSGHDEVTYTEEDAGALSSGGTLLGVGGIAVALAAKDTLANVFGSVTIFTDRPFQVGDLVSINGNVGSVEATIAKDPECSQTPLEPVSTVEPLAV